MIKINKKIGLEFLGEDYAESFVVLTAIPLKEYDEIGKQTEAIQKKENNKEAMEFMVNLIKDRFVSGSINQDGEMVAITKDDLDEFPGEFFLNAIQKLSGQDPNA